MTRRIGLLGGTFDPIHCGHLDAARAADTALGLTELWAVTSHIPPHRTQPEASAYHRFAMVALAIAGRPHWRASDIELTASTPSFTSATLADLHTAGYAATELFFIVGADAFADIASWRNYPAVMDQAHFVVVSRPGLNVAELSHHLPALASRMTTPSSTALRSPAPAIFLIDAVTADVSSTIIRTRCAAGQSIAGLVPAAVESYIEQQGLYANARPDAGASHIGAGPTRGRLHGQN